MLINVLKLDLGGINREAFAPLMAPKSNLGVQILINFGIILL